MLANKDGKLKARVQVPVQDSIFLFQFNIHKYVIDQRKSIYHSYKHFYNCIIFCDVWSKVNKLIFLCSVKHIIQLNLCLFHCLIKLQVICSNV